MLLIVVDSLRADRLSSYGYGHPTSPNLDRLAADSVRYERAYSQASWTTPSVGSLLSSQYPTRLGIRSATSALHDGLVLLPEVLRDHGYATAAVVSHEFCSSRWGFDQGFEYFNEEHMGGHQGVTGLDVSHEAIGYLRERWDRRRPFFLMVHYFDPHYSYYEHEGLTFGADEPYRGEIHSGIPFHRIEKLRRRGELRPRDVAALERLYASEVAYTDRAIGEVLDYLRSADLYDGAVIVFTADHGDEFLDHGGFGHTKTLYDEIVRVPLFVKLPGQEPGVERRPVALLDLYPTIVEAAGVAVPSWIEGRSLHSTGERSVFTETARKAVRQAVVSGRYKLIRTSGAGRVELYDVVGDPAETRDLAASEPAVVRRLTRELNAWSRRLASSVLDAHTSLTREDEEKLRALGYLDGSP